MSFAQQRRLGFTLIELLVVVAIIALLISMLLPALSGAREQSQQLLCQTNLRSIGHAAYFYAEENKDYLVQSESGNFCFVTSVLPGLGYDGPTRNLWDNRQTADARVKRQALRDICAKTKQLNCPRFPNPQQSFDYVINSFRIPYPRFSGDNPGNAPGEGPQSSVLPRSFFVRRAELEKLRPAMRVYVVEAHQSMPVIARDWNQLTDVFIPKHLPFASEPRIANDQRHPGGMNALFFDGHVSSIRLQRFDPGWPNAVSDRLKFFTDVVEE